jgi:hypothetical protein
MDPMTQDAELASIATAATLDMEVLSVDVPQPEEEPVESPQD